MDKAKDFIRLIGDPVLRTVCKEVPKTIQRRQIEQQKTALKHVINMSSWGLAANQLGFTDRFFCMATPKTDLPIENTNGRVFVPDGAHVYYTVFSNPKIVSESKETVYDYEACLSIDGLLGVVPRPQWIEAEFEVHDLKSSVSKYPTVRKLKIEGHAARIFCHELDHLNGVTFLDRIEDMRMVCSPETVRFHEDWIKGNKIKTISDIGEHMKSIFDERDIQIYFK